MSITQEDAAGIARTGATINKLVWGVAVAVMVFSLGTVTQLLHEHGVPWLIAWILAPAVDVALCVALVGDRVLHRYGVRIGWGTALRWISGLITLVLNVTDSALRTIDHGQVWSPDWVGVGIHSVPPLLLVVLTEASQAYQIGMAKAAAKAAAELAAASALVNRPAPSTPPAAPTRPAGTGKPTTGRTDPPAGTARPADDTGTAAAGTSGTGTAVPSGTAHPPVPQKSGTGSPSAAGTGDTGTDAAVPAAGNGSGHSGTRGETPRNAKELMLAYWIDEVRAGREPTGADLDRVAGVSPKSGLGRKRAKAWREMPLAELQAELAAGR